MRGLEFKLIRFKGGLVCPYCQGRQVVLWGKRKQVQRYRCKNCRKLFNDLTGTPMAHSKLLNKWPKAAAALQQSLTVRGAARYLGVCNDTSFRWRHRMLAGVKNARSQVKLSGIVEIDETFFPYSEKGSAGDHTPAAKEGQGRPCTRPQQGESLRGGRPGSRQPDPLLRPAAPVGHGPGERDGNLP